jgi:hypothetical protein
MVARQYGGYDGIHKNALFEDSWSMNPAELDFSEFRSRHIWGPPDSSGSRPCVNVALLRKPFPYSVIIWNGKTEALERRNEADPHCHSSLKRMGVQSIGP